MTRHEADRVHEASGIAFTFAGHLVWGNPKLSGGLAGDVEAWRCGRCAALVVGDTAEIDAHAEQHARLDAVETRLGEVVHGAFKPIEDRGHDAARAARVEKLREAIAAGAVEAAAWRD